MSDIPPAHDVHIKDMILGRVELTKLCRLRDFLTGMTWQPGIGNRQIEGYFELVMLLRTLCDLPAPKRDGQEP